MEAHPEMSNLNTVVSIYSFFQWSRDSLGEGSTFFLYCFLNFLYGHVGDLTPCMWGWQTGLFFALFLLNKLSNEKKTYSLMGIVRSSENKPC